MDEEEGLECACGEVLPVKMRSVVNCKKCGNIYFYSDKHKAFKYQGNDNDGVASVDLNY